MLVVTGRELQRGDQPKLSMARSPWEDVTGNGKLALEKKSSARVRANHRRPFHIPGRLNESPRFFPREGWAQLERPNSGKRQNSFLPCISKTRPPLQVFAHDPGRPLEFFSARINRCDLNLDSDDLSCGQRNHRSPVPLNHTPSKQYPPGRRLPRSMSRSCIMKTAIDFTCVRSANVHIDSPATAPINNLSVFPGTKGRIPCRRPPPRDAKYFSPKLHGG